MCHPCLGRGTIFVKFRGTEGRLIVEILLLPRVMWHFYALPPVDHEQAFRNSRAALETGGNVVCHAIAPLGHRVEVGKDRVGIGLQGGP